MSIGYNTAVMASRREPPDSLDFFPTPPWATRALFVHVMRQLGLTPNIESAWEPACGEGHMAAVMLEWARLVVATDVFDYGYGRGVVDFLDPSAGGAFFPRCDWIITNPPFGTAHEFAELALERAVDGVALLVRSQWIEGIDRWSNLFVPHPPAAVAQFVERVPIVKGRWDPRAKSATAYSWVVWVKHLVRPETRLIWIPPCREALTKPDDVRRFARQAAAPLLEE